MRIAVVGSRDYPDLIHVRMYVRCEMQAGDVLISGGARGVDATAEAEAKRRGLEVLSIRPNYDLFVRRAPLVRNEDIVMGCDTLIAFWDGKSRGTMQTIRLAQKRGIPVRIVTNGVIQWPESESAQHARTNTP